MKKNHYGLISGVCKIRKSKFLKRMRIVVLLILITVTQTFAVDGYGQSKRLSINLENETIINILENIEDQSEFYFMFDASRINVNQRKSVDCENQPISNILDQLFENTGITYSINDRQVLLSTTKKSDTEQPKAISGKVTDSSGASLPGVTVVVKGTTQGTVTNADGEYLLANVLENTILQFSFVGMKTQEIPVAGKTNINVTMDEETIGIDEVVAIGYGTKAKETLTGAISIVDNEMLENRPATQTTDLLQGISSGIQITRANTGNIRNSTNEITIRGVTSRSAPGVLVVVDGVAQSSTDARALDNINPDDIENISVLKDGQAAIYGARAAGGVILITTKKGKSDKPTIKFSSSYTIQSPALIREPCNILQLVEMHNEGYVNDGQATNTYTPVANYIAANNITFEEVKKNNGEHIVTAPFGIAYALGHYDWYDIMFDPSPMYNSNISISGKTDKLDYYESVNYFKQKGMLAYGKNYNKRFLITLKNDYSVTNFLKVISNFKVGNQKVVEPFNYSSTTSSTASSTTSFYSLNKGVQGALFFNFPTNLPYTSGGHYYNMGGLHNPIGYAKDSGNTTDLFYIINGNIGVEITPIENLLFYAGVASNYNIKETDWANIGFAMYDYYDNYNIMSTNVNQAGVEYYRDRYTTATAYLKYSYEKFENHKINIMVGYSHEENDYRSFSAYRKYGLISAELPTMSMGDSDYQYNSERKTDYALKSGFSRFEYAYKNRYLFEAIFRYDGSSKFADGYKWKPFWGFSGGWVVTDESFMENTKKIIDFMKIRGSWGQLGNQSSIGLYDYQSLISLSGSYPMGSYTSPTQVQSAYLGDMASTTRTWETIESINFGLDLTALNSRITSSFDFFIKDNKNMFYTEEYPSVLGTTPPTVNGAHVRTKGWELEFGWRDKINQLNYFIKINLSDNNTKIVKLSDSAIPSLGLNTFVEGNPLNSYYGYSYDGLIQTESELVEYMANFTSGIPNNLKVGDARFKDLDGDGKLEALAYDLDENGSPSSTSGDLVRVGDANQHYFYGINLGANWHNFDCSAFFQGVLNWDVVSTVRPCNQYYQPIEEYFYHQTWSEERTDAFYPRLSQNNAVKNYNYQYSDAQYKLYNNRYIRLKNIQLGYTLSKRITDKINVDKIRVYISGTDIWESSNLPGNQDPETPFTLSVTPFPRQYSFGIDLTF
ncbi:SusC/RagA family TonB-linked outer membrane protein [Maribellus comscasis]|uniref:SusC/RagA family TonB-linked outer membrane protein n=1 Tax=Maribellus comscasis TaxID=2681766 RepID=A0A6I6K167_9BACT|nr:TonB-dependent receptor [Maribellus comscasis]QGY46162.1 SusC/RagA family TonB-linked outer membrane protein [Maribellus comscasis]